MKLPPIDWSQRTILRIYVAFHQSFPGNRFWHRYFGRSLGGELLRAAQRQGIHQAILFHARVGYLEKETISHHFAESTPAKHPLCLELIDTPDMIQTFLLTNQQALQEATTVLLHAEAFQQIQMDNASLDNPSTTELCN